MSADELLAIRRQETKFEKPEGKVIWCPKGCGRPALLRPDGSWYCMIGHTSKED